MDVMPRNGPAGAGIGFAGSPAALSAAWNSAGQIALG